jgi:hypothetical protein
MKIMGKRIEHLCFLFPGFPFCIDENAAAGRRQTGTVIAAFGGVADSKRSPRGNLSGPTLLSKLWQSRAGKFLLVVVALAILVAALYGEEDLRGWRAWKKCQANIAAPLLYSAKPTPMTARARSDQFNSAYPEVLSWIGDGNGAGMLARMRSNSLAGFVGKRNPFVAAEITFLTPGDIVPGGRPDLVLNYQGTVLEVAAEADLGAAVPGTNDQVFPLIVMDAVPLSSAIKNLARQLDLPYSVDCDLAEYGQEPGQEPTVSIRWENITARQALAALLNNYALDLVQSRRTGVAHILSRGSRSSLVRINPRTARALKEVMAASATAQSNQPPVKHLQGSQGCELFAESPDLKPAQIWVRATRVALTNEIADFFSPRNGRYRVEPDGTNHFRVIRDYPASYTASDYVAWSDLFTNDFDFIRDRLTRPAAKIEVHVPDARRRRNFVALRILAQTLGQRAQSELLWGHPAGAARDLALLKELPRLFAESPTNLVQAMIEVAVQGIYLDVIADGLRLRAWREPELAALQAQLRDFDLLPLTWNGMQTEQATACQTLAARDFPTILKNASFLVNYGHPSEAEQTLQRIQCCALGLIPSGWVYENMAEISDLDEKFRRGVDQIHQRFSATRIDAASAAYTKAFQSRTPDNFLAAMIALDQTRCWRITAWRQTCANEAMVACALERMRIRDGEYPEALTPLVPRFLSRIPTDLFDGQPLRYRRTDSGHFQLYSIGWNEKDDGGIDRDSRDGDWVWGGSAKS